MTQATFNIPMLLNDLRKDDLKDILLILMGDQTSEGLKTKDDYVERIIKSKPLPEIEKVAAKTECLVPPKYVWLFCINQATPNEIDPAIFKIWESELWKDLFISEFGLPESDSYTPLPTLQFISPSQDEIYIKFIHKVFLTKKIVVDEAKKMFQMVSEQVRHSITVVIRRKFGIVEVRFDGFSQGWFDKDQKKIKYYEIAHAIKDIIAKRLNMSIVGLPPRKIVSRLLENMRDEISETSSEIISASGSISIKGNSGDTKDSASLLHELFQSKMSSDDIRETLNSSPIDRSVLFWEKYNVLTKISQNLGETEIFFIWKNADKTLTTYEKILNTFLNTAASLDESSERLIRKYIDTISVGSVFLLSQLINKYNVSYQPVLYILEDWLKNNLIEKRFKIKTSSLIENFDNQWRKSIDEFPFEVTTENGEVINLRDPQNIQVGFIKV